MYAASSPTTPSPHSAAAILRLIVATYFPVKIIQLLEQFGAGSGASVADTFTSLANKLGGVPMVRMAEPEEVASLVGFLVSPAAAYLKSANYAIDGGAIPVA